MGQGEASQSQQDKVSAATKAPTVSKMDWWHLLKNSGAMSTAWKNKPAASLVWVPVEIPVDLQWVRNSRTFQPGLFFHSVSHPKSEMEGIGSVEPVVAACCQGSAWDLVSQLTLMAAACRQHHP